MKIDAVTIFPDYFAPLQLSLLGKAQERGIVEFGIHDLRDFTTDNHHSVDDTPYGGGAGMVMKPEIWGAALDTLMTPETDLIILTPAGRRFDQNISDRNQIEKLRDTLMYSDVDVDAPGQDADDYHVLQLIGCEAFLESGEKLGEVSDVINLPGQDLLAIASTQGEVLIPFVRQLVPVVDIKNKRMTVIPPVIAGE